MKLPFFFFLFFWYMYDELTGCFLFKMISKMQNPLSWYVYYYRSAPWLSGALQVHTNSYGCLSSVSVIGQLWLCDQGQYLFSFHTKILVGLCLICCVCRHIQYVSHHNTKQLLGVSKICNSNYCNIKQIKPKPWLSFQSMFCLSKIVKRTEYRYMKYNFKIYLFIFIV